jgi:hypothetical protein
MALRRMPPTQRCLVVAPVCRPLVRSGAEQDLDGLAGVHGRVSSGGLIEGQFQVEDFAGLDRRVQIRSINSGRNRRTGAGPPWRWTWEKNSSMPSRVTSWVTPT